ncbi:MAG TPA: methyltransferase domain-containing protein [Nitrososphaerales archaeon]|nr:methyltransferase domain-containing protein [Nitrososphaerales archaeon]
MNYTEPYVPMPEDIIPIALKLASLKRNETVFDLGSGDGRILIVAARDFHAMAIGVEIRKRLVKNCLAKVKELGLSGRVKISCRNFKEVGLGRADVLALYLSGYTLSLLMPKFTKELKPGTRIVNFDFPILGWTPKRLVEVVPKGWRKAHPIYLYEV